VRHGHPGRPFDDVSREGRVSNPYDTGEGRRHNSPSARFCSPTLPLPQYILDLIERPIHLVVPIDIWRHEVEYISQRPQQQSALQESGRQSWPNTVQVPTGRAGFSLTNEFNRQHATKDPDVAD
jgi:hypothetical protein